MMQNTLHDRNVIAIDAMENDLVMRLQSGILETASPYRLIDGYVEFHDVKWDFSYVYLLGVTGNVGVFTGRFDDARADSVNGNSLTRVVVGWGDAAHPRGDRALGRRIVCVAHLGARLGEFRAIGDGIVALVCEEERDELCIGRLERGGRGGNRNARRGRFLQQPFQAFNGVDCAEIVDLEVECATGRHPCIGNNPVDTVMVCRDFTGGCLQRISVCQIDVDVCPA